ncbi:MAG: hypothetical protein E7322_08960 [Clostridiales bacterium]|nr:hypothetical protein [Clostridiales bacterium]
MQSKYSLQVNIKDFCVQAGIIMTFSGVVYTFLVNNLGGLAAILLSYVFAIGATILSKLFYTHENKMLLHSAVWLIIFVVVYVIGLELFDKTEQRFNIFGYSASLTSYNILKSFPIWLMGYVVCTNMNKREAWKCLYIIVFLLVWGMIATLWALNSEPDYVRLRTAGRSGGNYASIGAMGYELTYTIAIVYISLFRTLKQKNKVIAYIFGLLCIVYIVKCSLLLAITATLLNLSLSLAMGIRKKHYRLICETIIIIALVSALMNSELVGGTLIDLSEQVKNINISLRLKQIGRYLKFGDDDGASLARLDLYKHALNGFLTSPLIGNLPLDSGFILTGHSTTLDLLSAFGLLAGIPFISFWLTIYRYFKKKLVSSEISRIARTGIIVFVFITIFNPVFANVHIMFAITCILPLSAQLSDTKI